MYVCTYVCVRVCVCTCECTNVCTCVNMSVYVCVCTCVSVHVWGTGVCIRVCVSVGGVGVGKCHEGTQGCGGVSGTNVRVPFRSEDLLSDIPTRSRRRRGQSGSCTDGGPDFVRKRRPRGSVSSPVDPGSPDPGPDSYVEGWETLRVVHCRGEGLVSHGEDVGLQT